MDHLIYVLWHDCWKPWLKDLLLDIGYILFGIAVVSGIAMSWIFMTIYVERLIGG